MKASSDSTIEHANQAKVSKWAKAELHHTGGMLRHTMAFRKLRLSLDVDGVLMGFPLPFSSNCLHVRSM